MIQRSEPDQTVAKDRLISPSAPKNTASWSKLKDPRIVRVSRAFGCKDRHSKVCTVRGLRDRRVRLSVPTAIQLYDLQDRLGLNQPSKVVDWLLEAAKHEIDELPPLQIPQPLFTQTSSLHQHPNAFWERTEIHHETPAFFNYSHGQYNPFCRWEPSQLTLSQPTRSRHGTVELDDLNSFSFVSMPSVLEQLLVHSPEVTSSTIQSYFPSQMINAQEFDIKQMNSNYRTLVLAADSSLTSPISSRTSNSQPLRPFHFTMATDHLPLENNATADHVSR